MPKLKFMKYGGVKFKPLVSAKTINTYVRSLPESRKESMFEIAQELESQGMIKIYAQEEPITAGEDSCL